MTQTAKVIISNKPSANYHETLVHVKGTCAQVTMFHTEIHE